jgi:hypothetical protein
LFFAEFPLGDLSVVELLLKARSVDHDIAFVVSVFNQFSASSQLKSITSLVYYLHQLLSIVYKGNVWCSILSSCFIVTVMAKSIKHFIGQAMQSQ